MFKRFAVICAAAFVALPLYGGPSRHAAQGVSDEDVPTTYADCLLERIGTQLVRCDNLTGTGAAAPVWIPEQK